MNNIALNQTIFKKLLHVGVGFIGGDKKVASKTPRGWYVWINGFQQMPEIHEITEYFDIGSFEYPYLMSGMGEGGGVIKYWLCITEWEFVLLVGVKLNANYSEGCAIDYADDNEDYTVDVASFVFKDRIATKSDNPPEQLKEIIKELLLAHFAHFIGNNDISEFKSFIKKSKSKLLISVMNFYEKNFEQEINQTLGDHQMTDEEKEISDLIDKVIEDDKLRDMEDLDL
jgi:hypothetical protein